MLKYINTTRGLVVFPETFNHSDFKSLDVKIKSAGSFVAMQAADGKMHVALGMGGSMTLGISSNPEKDQADIERFVNNLVAGD